MSVRREREREGNNNHEWARPLLFFRRRASLTTWRVVYIYIYGKYSRCPGWRRCDGSINDRFPAIVQVYRLPYHCQQVPDLRYPPTYASISVLSFFFHLSSLSSFPLSLSFLPPSILPLPHTSFLLLLLSLLPFSIFFPLLFLSRRGKAGQNAEREPVINSFSNDAASACIQFLNEVYYTPLFLAPPPLTLAFFLCPALF